LDNRLKQIAPRKRTNRRDRYYTAAARGRKRGLDVLVEMNSYYIEERASYSSLPTEGIHRLMDFGLRRATRGYYNTILLAQLHRTTGARARIRIIIDTRERGITRAHGETETRASSRTNNTRSRRRRRRRSRRAR